jgi:hypothetical protein
MLAMASGSLSSRGSAQSFSPTPLTVTLGAARAYILALSPGVRHQSEWERAAELLMVAAESKSGADIEQATLAQVV